MALIDHVSIAPRRPRRMRIASLVSLWRSRRTLAHLDARALEDIGITQKAADFEATRSPWDVPDTWRNQ